MILPDLANVKWPARVVIPAGTYEFDTWPTISANRCEIVADGPVFLKHTGKGDAITFDGGTNGMFNCRFEGFTIIPGPGTARPLVLKSYHHSRVDVRVHGAGAGYAAIYMGWCVCTEVRPVVSTNEAVFDGCPMALPSGVTGLVLEANPVGSGMRTTACVIRAPILEGLGVGITIRGSDLCTIDGAGGTIEDGEYGIVFGEAAGTSRPGSHKVVNLEMEGNSAYDIWFGPGAHNNRVVYCGSPALKVYHSVGTLKELIPNNSVVSTTDLL